MSSGNALPFEKIYLEFQEAPIYAKDKKSYIFSFKTTYGTEIYYHKCSIPLKKQDDDKGSDPLYSWLLEYSHANDDKRLRMLEDQYEASGWYKHRQYKMQGSGELKDTDSLIIKTLWSIGSSNDPMRISYQGLK